MNRIDALFQTAREQGKKAFIAFLTAGDPDLATTVALARSLSESAERAGVPLILELGFPYSDPIADGAVIQASYTRALEKKVRIADIFAAAGTLRRETKTPLVAMVSYSLVFKRGARDFLTRAREAGFDGAIIPDLPVEEAEDVSAFGREHDFKIIQLVAPTTPEERAVNIVKSSSGFVYFISVTGITGERDKLPEDLPDRVAAIRRHTDLPICIGFGIGRPEQVAMLRPVADGVIVGSAIVRRLENLKPGDPAGVQAITDFVTSLLKPLA